MSDKLRGHLGRIPAAALAKLIGHDIYGILANLSLLASQEVTAGVLEDLFGSGLMTSRELRKKVALKFASDERAEVCELLGLPATSDPEKINERFASFQWGNNTTSLKIASYFEIDHQQFLTENPVEPVDSVLTVVPELDVAVMSRDPRWSTLHVYPLHPYQKEVKDDVVGKIRTPGRAVLIHMPTGSGKTKTAVEALCDFWRTQAGTEPGWIVWLAHSKELCNQAYSTFCDTWKVRGDRPLAVMRIFGSYTPDLTAHDTGVCFVGFQKLSAWIKAGNSSAFRLRSNLRVIVVDEAHKALAPDYSKSIEFLRDHPNARLLGLTATPGRSTTDLAANEAFHRYFGNSACRIPCPKGSSVLSHLQAHKYLAKLRRIEIRSEVELSDAEIASINPDSVDLPDSIRIRLSADEKRTLRILAEIELAVDGRGDKTLVFATSVPHCTVLRFLLQKRGISAECVFGHTAGPVRDEHIRSFTSGKLMVLINYNVLTTGFDAPALQTLVIARPTTSIILYSQMLGRALRGPRMGGKSAVNTLIDLVDNQGRFGTEDAAYNYFDSYFQD